MQRLNHFYTLALIGALVCASLLSAGVSRATAQDKGLSSLGLPELNVTVSADAYEGIPDEVEAGRYLVTLTASDDVGENGNIGFVKPEGMTPQEFLDAAAGPPDIAGADATPPLAAEGTPTENGEGEGGAPPEIIYSFKFAGGIGAPPGGSAQVVLDLTPGDWVAWGDNPEASQEPVIFTVSGEMPTDLVEPEASATITLAEYSIKVTEGDLKSGPQIIHVTNVGAQPHFIFGAKVPDGITDADVAAVLESEMTGTPPVVDFNPDEELMPAFGTGTQSMGTDIWVSVDLEPGTYGLFCFFPDIESGLPHAYEGMHTVIDVS